MKRHDYVHFDELYSWLKKVPGDTEFCSDPDTCVVACFLRERNVTYQVYTYYLECEDCADPFLTNPLWLSKTISSFDDHGNFILATDALHVLDTVGRCAYELETEDATD